MPRKKEVKAMALTLKEFSREVGQASCAGCMQPLPRSPEIEHYDHTGGWPVDGFEKKQWLTAKCFKCGYESSLAKLGVDPPQAERWKDPQQVQ